jgi:hypothetical protein
MKRLATIILAVGVILLGLAFIPLPIPLGAILVLTGVALLAANSDGFSRFIRFIRRNSSFLDMMFSKIAMILPATLNRVLKQTEP